MIAKLSVVVIGRNEGERLDRCLASIREMKLPDGVEREIIYVDSASTDGSPERAEGSGARVLQVEPERPCAAVGRNAGWRAADGELVFFLDGDTVVHPDFVLSALPEFEAEEIAVVWGHRRESAPEESLYNRVLDLDWVYPPGPSEFCGGDALMRRSVLEAVDGYDEDLIAGEEPELCRRIREKGLVIMHIDRAMTGHDLAIHRFSQYWLRATRAGHAYAEIAERFRNTDSPLWDREVRRNLVHAAVLCGCLIGLPALGLLFGSALPAVAGIGLFAVLVARTATRVGWKTDDAVTAWLYAIHSHLQQIPICVGQLSYRLDQLRGRRRGLIEYKEVPAGS